MYQRPLRPTDLGIIMSYQCQCACKHCLYNCGPRWKDWVSSEILRDALQATQAWHHRFQVHLTGGEPFLNFPLLLEGVRIATELDIPCYVETNAGWCLREEDVAEKFAALREAGLNAVLISCSPFHAEKIPPARTFLAIRKALEMFGRQRVMVPVKSNENVTERRSFSQMKMLPGCPSPFFDFDDLGGAGLKS